MNDINDDPRLSMSSEEES
jgi:hypothetical protein